MPYLTTDITVDQYGVEHPVGVRERVDLITNPLAIINRTIPMVMYEGSISFILDRVRKHANTLDTDEEKKNFMFDVLRILNPKQTAELEEIYAGLSKYAKKKFIEDCISIDHTGHLRTDNGLYMRWEPFNDEWCLRDSILKVYEKYGDILKPYYTFMPKPKWGRDVCIGQHHVGYQYIMMLKQSGEKGFSVRSAGAISDESLPEKSHSVKISREWHSSKPIRFGEYETPNFLVITAPEDFALVQALYRSSVDGRRWMYEAILSDDGNYNLPDKFTSRAVEILQVYLKSLGVEMETVHDEDEFIIEPEHREEIVELKVGHAYIMCTVEEKYYLKKLHKVYKKYMKEHPNRIANIDDVMEYIMEHLPFKKKYLTEHIVEIFKNNLTHFAECEEVI